MSRRRRGVGLTLLVAFVVVPLAEIYVLIQVGQAIGAWWTIALLILDSILGTWLVKHEGSRAWRGLGEALATGRMPAKELADGALILIGGTLLVTPGFVTDVVGFLAILPFTRPVARRLLTAAVARRLAGGVGAGRGRGGPNGPRNGPGPGPGSGGPVIRGDVVDDG